jgi:hypothetical protein
MLLIISASCSMFEKEGPEGKDVIAKAFDYYLYRDDLNGVVPPGATLKDSISVVKNYIDNWVRQKVVLHKAENNLNDEKKNVQRQLEEYRNSLVVYAYENELIRQKLDTIISETEIEAFYKNNQANFQLKDNIIKVIYLKLSKKTPKLNKARDWYKSSAGKDREALKEYCRQYALNYYLDDNAWLLFDDLLKEIPIRTYDKEQFLQNNRLIEIEDSVNIYLVNIKGFMIKNSLSPLSFERNNIRNMIINERKLNLITEMEQQAFNAARKNGDAEVY